MNCNIKPKQKGYCDWDSNCPYPHHKCNDECPYWKYEDEAKYPPFTAEKQIEIIKWLAGNKGECRITYDKEYKWCTQTDWQSSFCYDNFPASLVNFINNIWQDLTEAEQNEIREILE